MNIDKKLILVVDDEPQIHRFLGPALEASGYAVVQALDAASFLRLAATRAPDAVLLDLGLPDMDGREALMRLRAFSTVPVIVLSARNREVEKIAALDEGADDYVEKPFGLGELLARLRLVLRRQGQEKGEPEPASVLQAGLVTLDSLAHQVRVSGALIQLSPREYALLDALMRNPGRVLTHRQLLVSVWGPAHAQDVQYLRVYIGHLRQKLGAEAAAMIATEPAIGYRLTVPELLDAETAAAAS